MRDNVLYSTAQTRPGRTNLFLLRVYHCTRIIMGLSYKPTPIRMFFPIECAVTGYVKLALPAGKANPAPPVGPALGAKGVNIMQFCKEYNAATQDKIGTIIPVEITVYEVSWTSINPEHEGISLIFFWPFGGNGDANRCPCCPIDLKRVVGS